MKDNLFLLWLLTGLVILLGIFRACLGFGDLWVLKLRAFKPKHPDERKII
jgi:hypothetical protein